jgi:hypothetical protein
VNVEVKNCLTGGRAAIDADVVAVGSMGALHDSLGVV